MAFSKTVILVADTDTVVSFDRPDSSGEKQILHEIIIFNRGSVDAFVRMNAVAEIDGDDNLVIPPLSSRTDLPYGQEIHLISAGSPKVEVQGVLR